MVLESTITCPACGHKATEHMPTDACQYFYDCKGCGKRLKPKAGDCCVFCSYGSMPCPPIQSEQGCCHAIVDFESRAEADAWTEADRASRRAGRRSKSTAQKE